MGLPPSTGTRLHHGHTLALALPTQGSHRRHRHWLLSARPPATSSSAGSCSNFSRVSSLPTTNWTAARAAARCQELFWVPGGHPAVPTQEKAELQYACSTLLYACVCMCAYMCALYVYVYACVYMHVHVCVHTYACICVQCVCMCMCVYNCVYTHMCMSVCVHCTDVCMYTHRHNGQMCVDVRPSALALGFPPGVTSAPPSVLCSAGKAGSAALSSDSPPIPDQAPHTLHQHTHPHTGTHIGVPDEGGRAPQP